MNLGENTSHKPKDLVMICCTSLISVIKLSDHADKRLSALFLIFVFNFECIESLQSVNTQKSNS